MFTSTTNNYFKVDSNNRRILFIKKDYNVKYNFINNITSYSEHNINKQKKHNAFVICNELLNKKYENDFDFMNNFILYKNPTNQNKTLIYKHKYSGININNNIFENGYYNKMIDMENAIINEPLKANELYFELNLTKSTNENMVYRLSYVLYNDNTIHNPKYVMIELRDGIPSFIIYDGKEDYYKYYKSDCENDEYICLTVEYEFIEKMQLFNMTDKLKSTSSEELLKNTEKDNIINIQNEQDNIENNNNSNNINELKTTEDSNNIDIEAGVIIVDQPELENNQKDNIIVFLLKKIGSLFY